MGALAWLRRVLVSIGIGGTSFILMMLLLIVSFVWDEQMEPLITWAFNSGREIVDFLDRIVVGSRWGQVMVNHLRERVNMTHVVLSIPMIVIATFLVGIPLNWMLGGARTALQRIVISFASIPLTVVLAIVLFTFNAIWPETYSAVLRSADWVWKQTLAFLTQNYIPGSRKLANAARMGFSGHHYVIMAFLTMIASFLVNALFALLVRRAPTKTPPSAHARNEKPRLEFPI